MSDEFHKELKRRNELVRRKNVNVPDKPPPQQRGDAWNPWTDGMKSETRGETKKQLLQNMVRNKEMVKKHMEEKHGRILDPDAIDVECVDEEPKQLGEDI